MKTTTAYYVPGCAIALCKGQAKDLCGNSRENPWEITLHYEGDLNELLKGYDEAWYVSSALFDPCVNERISKHFFMNREDAINAAREAGAEEAGVWNSYSVYIENRETDYTPMKLPVRTTLMRNDKGLYCRLNLHPEEDGYRSPGKIFFPDRKCGNSLCEGPVIITSVHDKGNYGFFTGEMVQYEAPSDEQVSEHVIKNSLYDRKLRFMKGKLGSYVEVDGGNCFVAANSGCEFNYDVYDYGEAVSKCTEEILGVDLVCQGFQGCNFEEFYNRFVKFEFQSFHATWCIKFISKLFDEAIKYRFIALKTTNNVDFVEVDKGQLMYALDQFSREEMAEIIAKVTEINTKANETIKSKMRSGKVRLC